MGGCSCFCICHRGNKPGAGSLRPFSISFCSESQRPCPGLQNKAQEVLLGMSFTLTCSQAKGRRIREAFPEFFLLPPSIFPSISVFSSESVLHIRWPKYWSFSFSISPSNEYSGLISFRMDWLELRIWGKNTQDTGPR